MKKIRTGLLLVAMGVYVFIFPRMDFWRLFSGEEEIKKLIFHATALVTLIGLIGCCMGMLRAKDLARRIFLGLNVLYMGYGAFGVHFSWTFWLGSTPTLWERVVDSSGPFAIGILLPLVLIIYFVREKKKA